MVHSRAVGAVELRRSERLTAAHDLAIETIVPDLLQAAPSLPKQASALGINKRIESGVRLAARTCGASQIRTHLTRAAKLPRILIWGRRRPCFPKALGRFGITRSPQHAQPGTSLLAAWTGLDCSFARRGMHPPSLE